MRVAVLMGGRSSEREISLRTGRGIARALRALGHEVTSVDAADGAILPAGDEESGARAAAEVGRLPLAAQIDLVRAPAVREADVVYIALHGTFGEDGRIQALLELAGKAYTGSGVLASALAMDKAMSKRVFLDAGVPTPRWRLGRAGEVPGPAEIAACGGLPLVVKPNEEGSTVGLTIVREDEALAPAWELAARYGDAILLEEYIPGRELTVAVLEDEALPLVEIRPKSGFYDYENKYTAGRTDYFCPADLAESLAERIRGLGVTAARALGCSGVSRVDFRLDPRDVAHCLEVNTIPGMTPTSLVPMAARAVGMTYEDVVARALELATSGIGRAGAGRSGCD
ncbi:MAG TPA: D-alanine--D-alanine ligase [Terriglobales bacterium]|nr:D-alanine--D-alanine ligase [Terriglobales bacterium]